MLDLSDHQLIQHESQVRFPMGFYSLFLQGLESPQDPNLCLSDSLGTLSWEQTHKVALELAQKLADTHGVVAIAMGRSSATVLVQLAISLNSGTFLTLLEPSSSNARYTLDHAQPQWLVVSTPLSQFQILEQSLTLWDSHRLPLGIIYIYRFSTLPVQQQHTTSSTSHLGPKYIVYSSGSSGTPKGMELLQAGACFVIWQQIQKLHLKSHPHCLWVLNPAFDASLSDIYCALGAGAHLVCFEPALTKQKELLRTFLEWPISYVDFPPSLFSWLEKQTLPALKTVLFGGETAPEAITHSLSLRYRMVQAYGPSETSICAAMNEVNTLWQAQNIGEPLVGFEFFTHSGVLCIRSALMCSGYLHQRTLTDTRFMFEADFIGTFNTNDLAHYVPLEEINAANTTEHSQSVGWHFLGRADRQFKHHGQLVCPEEIEQCYLRLGASYAKVHYDGKIHLYYCAPHEFDHTSAQVLATYMQPSHFHRQTAPSTNANQKSILPTDAPPTIPSPNTSNKEAQ